MPSLQRALSANKTIRVIGFDDAPFKSDQDSSVDVAGIVCADTRFEGMLWGSATKDGDDATTRLADLVLQSKFHDQLHIVLIDGIAVGGFNIVRLKELSGRLALPCVSLMRRLPNMPAIRQALKHFDNAERRLAYIEEAGEIYQRNNFVFQVQDASGADTREDLIAQALSKLTSNGMVPEALRLAHLIGSAVKTGQSSSRA